jgi:serine/threonine protein phosphatase 1
MFEFLRKKPSSAQRDNHIPPQMRLYAVGDIHGRLDLLDRVLESIKQDAVITPQPRHELVFLGDYVDRGFHSRGVLERLRSGLPDNFYPIFLRGNHEEVMLRFYDGDMSIALDWFYFGGRETLASYGIAPPPPNVSPDKIPSIHAEFVAKIPAEDITFLRATQLHYVCGDYSFVHAGIRPGLALEQQLREDLLFIRSDFMQSDDDFGTLVVHGHTIVEAPEVRHNRISIDTGAYATGRLTCLVLEGSTHRFLQS